MGGTIAGTGEMTRSLSLRIASLLSIMITPPLPPFPPLDLPPLLAPPSSRRVLNSFLSVSFFFLSCTLMPSTSNLGGLSVAVDMGGGGLHSTSDESESALLDAERRGGRSAALTRATGFCGWFFSHDGVFFAEWDDDDDDVAIVVADDVFFSMSFFRLFRLLSVHSSDSLLADIAAFGFLPGGRPLRFSLELFVAGFLFMDGSSSPPSSSSESDDINGFDLIFDGGGSFGTFIEPFFLPLFFFSGSSAGRACCGTFFVVDDDDDDATGIEDFLQFIAVADNFTACCCLSKDFLRSFFSHLASAEYFLCRSVTGLDEARERLLHDESLSQLLSRVLLFFFLSSSSSEDEDDDEDVDDDDD